MLSEEVKDIPKFLKHEVLPELLDVGLLPTFYNGDVEVTKNIIRACFKGGANVVEFTNRGDFAYRVFSQLSEWVNEEFEEVIFGTGTIVDPDTATLYIDNGASFVVGPLFNPEVAKVCNRRKVPYIPGCATPSEISEAHEAGADLIKVFPATSVGPEFIKSVLGPCKRAKLMPSGGVKATEEDVSSWIDAGASVLNMGSDLVRKDLLEERDFGGITERVEKVLSWIEEAR